jgi:hypothetical protein
MNLSAASRPVELGPEEDRRCFQDLIRPTQLGVVLAQLPFLRQSGALVV